MTRNFQINNNYLIYKNFKFYKSIKLGNGQTLWKCKTNGCSGELKTNTLNTKIVHAKDEHNHSYVVRKNNINSTPNSSHVSRNESQSSISPINNSRDSEIIPAENCENGITPEPMLHHSRFDDSSTDSSENDRLIEALRMENESLRRELTKLRREWDAAVQHSIDVDTKLLLLTERDTRDADTQTDITSTSSAIVQTDNSFHTREMSVQTTEPELSPTSQLTQFINNNEQSSLDKLTSPHKFDVHSVNRLLTDDDIVQGTQHLGSRDVVVLTPAVCLSIRLSADYDVKDHVSPSIFDKRVIIAPISNAEVDHTAGLNTMGTHWSLVVVNLVKREYHHLDSIPHLNDSVARRFCKKLNTVLNINPFLYRNKKCTRQQDSHSCGIHVIKNAENQVKLLREITNTDNKCISQPSITKRKCISLSKDCTELNLKTRVMLIGDSHVRNLASYLQILMPKYQVFGYCYPGAPLSFVLEKLDKLIEPLGPTDYVIIVGGTNNTSASHLSKVVNGITGICNRQSRPNVVLTEMPHILVKSIDKRKEIVKCNNTLYYLAKALRLPFVVFGSYLDRYHYQMNGKHLNVSGKKVVCSLISELLLRNSHQTIPMNVTSNFKQPTPPQKLPQSSSIRVSSPPYHTTRLADKSSRLHPTYLN